jgi:CRISPR-associated endonuclease/helicase Cas3
MSAAIEAYERLMGWPPNPMQEAAFPMMQSGDCALLLEAPTGSGKTEAVLVPALTDPTPRRLFLIYPSRSLIEDQVARLEEKVMPKVSADGGHKALVIDHGAESERQVWVDGEKRLTQRRHLYDGDVIVTTLDKFLYRFFGYGGQTKSYIFPFRIHHGAQAPLFCFDEAHSYDDIAFGNFVDLVRALYLKGLELVVMTATLPPAHRATLDFLEELNFADGPNVQRLTDFYRTRYPGRVHPGKRLSCVSADGGLMEMLIAQAEAHYRPGQRAIIVAEEVRAAAAVYATLCNEYGEKVLLYHGRLPHAVRRETYRKLKERDDQGDVGPGYLLVTTSAIEVGCDLDAHTLITEVCNPEQLIQRAGRCNRRETIPNAQLIVVGEHIKPYLRSLSEDDEAVYLATLQAQDGETFDVIAIRECIRVRPQPDYRVQMLFQMLYEYVYEAERVNRPLHEKGLVITRSWEPSLTLATAVEPNGRIENPVSVNWSACATKDKANLTPGCRLHGRTYSDDRWYIEPVTGGGGCAYFRDLVLVAPGAYDSALGYVQVPKVFLDKPPKGGYKHWLVYPYTTKDPNTKRKKMGKVWFWYVDRLPKVSEEEGEEGLEDVD